MDDHERNTLEYLYKVIDDDTIAISFQSIRHYRECLKSIIKDLVEDEE